MHYLPEVTSTSPQPSGQNAGYLTVTCTVYYYVRRWYLHGSGAREGAPDYGGSIASTSGDPHISGENSCVDSSLIT